MAGGLKVNVSARAEAGIPNTIKAIRDRKVLFMQLALRLRKKSLMGYRVLIEAGFQKISEEGLGEEGLGSLALGLWL